jgi:hypothetical protein
VGPDKQEFCIHKGVLCSNSSYFARALSGNFQEAHTNAVELDDVHVLLFKIFVAWLYTGKLTYESSDQDVSAQDEFGQLETVLKDQHPYEEEEDEDAGVEEEDSENSGPKDDLSKFNQETPNTWTLLILCALFVLADRLDVPKLKNITLDTIIARVQTLGVIPTAPATLYTYAHKDEEEKKACRSEREAESDESDESDSE